MDDFFISARGILKAKELSNEDSILGSEHGKLTWRKAGSVEVVKEPMFDAYLEHTELTCSTNTKLSSEGLGPRPLSDLLREFQTYGGSRLRIEKSVISPNVILPTNSHEPKIPGSLSPADYCLLGLLVRRAPIYDEVFLRVRKVRTNEILGMLSSIAKDLSFSIETIVHSESETLEYSWAWIEIRCDDLRSFLAKSWPTPNEIPNLVRRANWTNLQCFMIGVQNVLAIVGPEGLEFQTFKDERDLRLMLGFHSTLLGRAYISRPEPLYGPYIFHLSMATEKQSFSSVRAVVSKGEAEAIRFLDPGKNWYPLVNLTFVG